MCTTFTESIQTYNSYDPTRTTTLRNAFASDMRRRFTELIRMIKVGVEQQDAFGLRPATPRTLQTHQMQPPGAGAFSFPRSVDKIAVFIRWLEEQIEAGILMVDDIEQVGTSIDGAWMNKYIHDSYKRGVHRARYEMKKAGYDVPSIDETGGIDISMSTPFHVDRLGVLFTRTFTDLKGITDAMDSLISRVLTQGIADGDNPRVLARKLVAVINGEGVGDLGIRDSLGRFIPARRRAEILSRTEIIRAHHQAMIQEYMNWRVLNITVQAEWRTAGDNRVCAQCEPLEGEVFTLEVAMGMIPLHPQCRCIALPFKQSHKTIKAIIPEDVI